MDRLSILGRRAVILTILSPGDRQAVQRLLLPHIYALVRLAQIPAGLSVNLLHSAVSSA